MSSNNNNKMKGFLKGLRYISQIFENEKEPEMQIGFPTDVKHVAHIGWDGPSVSTPSWMNEFTSSPQSSSCNEGGDRDARWVSEGSPLHESSRRGARGIESPARDLPEMPKTRRSSRGLKESPSRGKTERSKQTMPSTRNKESSSDGTRSARSHVKDDVRLKQAGSESPSNSNSNSNPKSGPDIPKKTRRKKSKDSSLKPSSGPKAQNAEQAEVIGCSESGPSIPKTSNNTNDHHSHTSSLSNIEDRQKIGVLGISREC